MIDLPLNNKKPHILSENKISLIPTNTIFFDSETKTTSKILTKKIKNPVNQDYQIEKLRLGFWENWKKNKDNTYSYINSDFYYTKEDFRNVIIEKFNKSKTNLYIIAHNLNFDFSSSLRLDFFKNFDIVRNIITPNIFILQFKEKNTRNKKSIIFLDSFNYFKTSIEEMGKLLNIEKIQIKNFNSVSKEKLKKRCMKDVEILRKMFFKLLLFCDKNDMGKFGYTIPSLSFNCFRHKFMKNKIHIHNNIRVGYLERLSYFGGRNECFKLGKYEDIYKLDINSSYPYVMKEYPYPTKLIKFIKNPDKKDMPFMQNEFNEFVNGTFVGKFDIETNKPIFPYRTINDKVIFPVGKFTTYLTFPEIITNTECIKKIHEIAIYEEKFLFKDFITHFYNLKLQYKKQNNDIFEYICKLIMNSLSGKFGQKMDKYIRIPEYDNLFNVGLYSFIENNKKIDIKFFNKEAFIKIGCYENNNSFPAIIGHITAYARHNLQNFINEANIDNDKNENVLYVDTDSLFVNQEGFNNLKENGDISQELLGKLKIEDFGNINIRGCKDYIFNGEEKIKGIKKNSKKINDNNYEINRFLGWNERYRFFDVNEVIKTTQIKHLNRKYDKGIVNKDNTISPIKFKEW